MNIKRFQYIKFYLFYSLALLFNAIWCAHNKLLLLKFSETARNLYLYPILNYVIFKARNNKYCIFSPNSRIFQSKMKKWTYNLTYIANKIYVCSTHMIHNVVLWLLLLLLLSSFEMRRNSHHHHYYQHQNQCWNPTTRNLLPKTKMFHFCFFPYCFSL